MDAKQISMVHRLAKNVVDTAGWDLIKDKDIILLQADVNLLDGLASFDILGLSVSLSFHQMKSTRKLPSRQDLRKNFKTTRSPHL